MQQNVELQRELETLRTKLEYTFTLLNEKLDQHSATTPTSSLIQTAIEQMRQSDAQLQQLQLKTTSQQEENDLLRYLVGCRLSSCFHLFKCFAMKKKRIASSFLDDHI
jgi:hypothetical protein